MNHKQKRARKIVDGSAKFVDTCTLINFLDPNPESGRKVQFNAS
jgi:hypothetical protein